MNRQYKKIWWPVLVGILLGVALVASVAKNASDENVTWSVISGGGSDATSANYQLHGTVSQTAVGQGSSQGGASQHGYWQNFIIWIPAEAEITVSPRVLSLRSRGRWIHARIELVPPYSAEEIDITSVKLQDLIPADPASAAITDADEDGISELSVSFDRVQFQEVLPEGEYITVTVSGTVRSRRFSGDDVIRTIRPKVNKPGGTGGEVVLIGEETLISWTSPSGYTIDSVDVFWTANDGESWDPIARGVPDTGTIMWMAPNAIHDSCRVIVTIYSDGEDLGMGMSPELFSLSGTVAISLVSFSAAVEQGAAVLSWTTAAESNVDGFHIYRATERDGVFEQLTEHPIAARGSTGGSTYQYVDNTIRPNQLYYYQLKDVSGSESKQVFGPCQVIYRLMFDLQQNVPNPFNPATTIAFSLSEKAPVTLSIFNIDGRLVKTLVDQFMDEGVTEISWDGTDQSGNRVASGIYLYRLKAGKKVRTKKMVMLK